MRGKQRIAVVGAGIVGAAIAWQLACRGAAVTLIDAARPAAGSTGRAFAWIVAGHGLPAPYRRLRHQAVEAWRRVEPALGGDFRVDWCGALTWSADPAETERFAREHGEAGDDLRLVERAEIARMEPAMIDPPDLAAFAPGEGAIDPLAATEAFVEGARAAGATLRFDSPVAALETKGGRLTALRLGSDRLEVDAVVLAAGTGAKALAAGVGIALPLEASPAILLRFGSGERVVRSIVSGPEIEVRQDAAGRFFAAEDVAEGVTPETIAGDALAALRRRFRGTEALGVESIEIGQRPMPADEQPIVGFAPDVEGLYLASMHAGVTLAPIVANLAAGEILEGREAPELAGCRIARFAAG